MPKKNRKRSPEIPRVGNALEVPNYVIPMTDLEYRETVDGTRDPANAQDCGENCGDARSCAEICKN